MNLGPFCAASSECASFESFIRAPYFRRSFVCSRPLEAQLSITSPGFYELFVNGKRITRGRFSPDITNPDHFVTVDEYDLLPYLNEGGNAIGVLLGNGIVNCIGGHEWEYDTASWHAVPSFALCSQIKDGTPERQLTLTAADFVTAPSPILFNDMRAGEWYDAAQEIAGWANAEYDDSTWRPAIVVPSPRGELRPSDIDPITVEGERQPVSAHHGRIAIQPNLSDGITQIHYGADEDGDGVIYDFGENLTGVVRLTVFHTYPGQKIILQYGEILGENPTGGVDTTIRTQNSGLDLRGFHCLPQRFNHRDVYICRGASEETWEPTFTIHGFRYCLILGAKECDISPVAVILHTELRKRAEFACSDEMTNHIWKAVLRTDLGNFCHYPTDCPHREKNFWLGDAAVSAEQFVELFSCERNLRAWLRGFSPAMRKDDALPGIVPTGGWGFGWSSPGWDGALIEIPFQIWKYRGDLSPANENADAIIKSLKYLAGLRNKNGLVDVGIGADWVQAARDRVNNPKAHRSFVSTLTLIDLCRKATILFRALGMETNTEYSERLGTELRSAARKHLIDLDTLTAIYRCQTAQAMALACEIFEPGERKQAFNVLLKLIDENDGSIDCGIHGLRVLFHVLSRFERSDLAFDMITKTSFPSYGYWFAHGATTLWELFSPIGRTQSSCNHHFTGDVANWFLQRLAGIQVNPFDDDPREIRIAPSFIPQITNVSASLETPYGTIHTAWRRVSEDILLSVTIPDGMNGQLRLESPWQTDYGFTALPLTGTMDVRIFPITKPNLLKRFDKQKKE